MPINENLANWFAGSHEDVTDETGAPKRLYVGTLSDFGTFDRSKMSVGGDHGQGFYATSNPADASVNYASKSGPDYISKLHRIADSLRDHDEEDLSEDDLYKLAESQLPTHHEGAVMPIHMALKNPVILGGKNETYYTYEEPYNEKTDEYGEPTGTLIQLINGVEEAGRQFQSPTGEIVDDLISHARDYGHIPASRAEKIIKDGFQHAYDDFTGDYASNEAWRTAVEEAGHDGIIDHTVDTKFGSSRRGFGGARIPGMHGVEPETTHYIAFDNRKIKSATGNQGTYDPNNPDITKAEGGTVDLSQYQDSNNFGLYSHAAETAAALPQAKGTPDQFKAMLMKQGVKPVEIENSNYDETFAGRPSVTKDELVQHFRQNMPKIQEHVLGAKSAYPQDLRDKEQAIISSYLPRIAELQARAGDYSLPSAERAQARDDVQDLYDQMHSHIDREIPERGRYLGDTPTKFHNYTMPGGENYRELLLQLKRGDNKLEQKAAEAYQRKSDLVAQYDQIPPGDPRGPQIAAQIQEAQREYSRIVDESMKYEPRPFNAGHWDQADVLAHLRMKDRTGPNGEKILHVDEIQSDWGQKGRNQGFQNQNAEKEFNDYINSMRATLLEQNKNALIENNLPEDSQERVMRSVEKQIAAMRPDQIAKVLGGDYPLNLDDKTEKLRRNDRLIPTAPYVTNTAAWTDLALKRALHEAASGGYDKIVFTKGQDQADRYDLSSQIEHIEANPLDNGRIHLVATSKEDGDVVHEGHHDIDKIDDVIGKELADKVRSQIKFPEQKKGFLIKNKRSGNTADMLNTLEAAQNVLERFPESLKPDLVIVPREYTTQGRSAVLRGVDLKIGGEGMKSFYDKIVPKQLNELVKRHDPSVRVGPGSIDTPDGPKDVHSLDITPKMRDSILRGQKAFAAGGEVDDDGITAYHGSPHDFDQFDISKIGTGEGAQAYGHGLYFAQHEPVAEGYRDRLSQLSPKMMISFPQDTNDIQKTFIENALKRSGGDVDQAVIALQNSIQQYEDAPQNWINNATQAVKLLKNKNVNVNWENDYPKGHMYEVSINAHPDHFLDWDKPLDAQPYVMQKLIASGALHPNGDLTFMYNETPRRGGEMYERLTSPMAEKFTGGKSQKHASDFLHSIGIKGIKYLDARSRDAGEGSRNYVVFDDKLVNVKRKYAEGGIVEDQNVQEADKDDQEGGKDRRAEGRIESIRADQGRGSGHSGKLQTGSGGRRPGWASSVKTIEAGPVVDRALMVISRKAKSLR